MKTPTEIRAIRAKTPMMEDDFIEMIQSDATAGLKIANSILRAAMYDIMEYDADGDQMAYCGQVALKALDASALDEQGRIAKPHNGGN